ncbi:MAG: EboA domain-containing protein [Polyangiales bacterium]
MDHDVSREALLRELTTHLDPDATGWLTAQLADRAMLAEAARFRVTFARAARKLGRAGDRTLPSGPHDAPWSVLDLARALLLSEALATHAEGNHAALVSELFRTGELREQQSILRALPLLPGPARFTTLAIEACRTNSPGVFTAIAHDNPFPATHFPELSFNQLVLKAIFLGLSVLPIRALARRATPELRRMVSEYAIERRAAGRTVPPDVAHVLALTAPDDP